MARLLRITMGLVLALGAAAAPASASTGLVGQWRLDDGAGTVATDSSGYGDSGTVAGGAAWITSPTGGALDFNGATGRVQVPDAPQLEPTDGVSVAAWVARKGSPGDYKYIVSKGATGCIAGSYGLYSGPQGGLEFYVSQDQGTQYARSADPGPGVWDGNWHLVVGTFDGDTIRLYVDGREIGSGTPYAGPLSYQLPDSNDLYIGDYPGCQRSKNFLGDIGDVEIWNHALSAAEVDGLLQPPVRPVLPQPVTVPVPSAPPIASPQSPGAGQGVPTSSPFLGKLSLSRWKYTQTTVRTLTVTYADHHAGLVTFTLLKLRTVTGASCRQPGEVRLPSRTAHCLRYAALGSFTRVDRPGRNRVRLPNGWHSLKPGQYRLVATPRSAGQTGGSVSVRFRVAA